MIQAMALIHYVLLAVAMAGVATDGARILSVFPFPARSHVRAFLPLMEELARRGHEVTVITSHPLGKTLKNYREIITKDHLEEIKKDFNFFKMGQVPFFIMKFFMVGFVADNCEKFISEEKVQNLINDPNEKFDLILYERFYTQCTYGLLHRFKAPSIQMVPNTLPLWIQYAMGNPSTIAYVPSMLNDVETTGFRSRLRDVFYYFFGRVLDLLITEPKMESIMRKHFPDSQNIPSIQELEGNASFLFLHSHPVLNHPRPFTPNTIDVAGLHIKAKNELPQDLKKFLDDAKEGVIYFSLGSNVRSADMPDELRETILKTFSKLKEKVLWKWEEDVLPGQPPNVRLGKWLPQHAILAHPNVKAFMTHGGLMSLQEATFFGKPLLVLPLAADQRFNADVAANRGLGVVLDFTTLTEAQLGAALAEVLGQPKYRQAAARLSSIFQDQPQTPLERGVFWAEYALRHKGAPHLRSAALDLSFVQYYLLDVLAFLGGAALAALALLVWGARLLLRLICRRASPPKASARKKNN